jgi:hypothetical protein
MSDNIFKSALTDVKHLEEELLGPDYNYFNQIKTPSELGMSDKGTTRALTNDVSGLIEYVSLLVSGKSKASKTGQPLGNKFFLKTGAKCKDIKTGQQVQRYMYVNNVPDGSIPFITNALDVNFGDFKGLVPGTLSNVARISPTQILQSFLMGTNPDCQSITLDTIDVNNNKNKETQYLTTVDIQNMSPCWFPDKKNSITNEKCKETFSNLNEQKYNNIPDYYISNIYFGTLGIFGLYILFRLMNYK